MACVDRNGKERRAQAVQFNDPTKSGIQVPGEVSMYVCGVTSYESSHLGHAGSAVAFEVRPFPSIYLYKRTRTLYICIFEFGRLIDLFDLI